MISARFSGISCLVVIMLALAGPTSAVAAPEQAAQAPQTRFETTTGTNRSLDDHRGTVVVLNLWATWCSPCLVEIPHLVDLQRRIEPHGAIVIGLALDSGDAQIVTAFWEKRLGLEPNYPLWLGSVEQARDIFGARTYPQTFIIDREGRIRQQLLGLQTEQALWEALQPYL